MKGSYYVSDILTPERFKSGFVNVVECPTGSGKTTAIFEKLPQYVDSNNEILFITDNNMNRSQTLATRLNTQAYNKNWREYINACTKEQLTPNGWGDWNITKITTMNYHEVGAVLHFGYEFDWSKFTYVVMDEAHNLIYYQNMKSKNGSFNVLHHTRAKIEDTLAHYPSVKIIALTATPKKVYEAFRRSRSVFTPEEIESLYQYEIGQLWYYRDIQKILSAIPIGARGIIYTARIRNIKQYQEFLISKGHKAIGFWSTANKDPEHVMTVEQLEVRQHIIDEKVIPQGIDILVINKACETGIDIKNKDLTFMVVHATYGSDTFIQAKGRIRNDIPNVYYRDNSYNDASDNIPDEYLDTPLTADVTKKLAVEVIRLFKPKKNEPYKWGKEIKEFLESKGYSILETKRRIGKKSPSRVTIISRNDE